MPTPRHLSVGFLAALSVAVLPTASASAADGTAAPAVAPSRALLPVLPLPGVPLLTGLPTSPDQLTGLTSLLGTLAGGGAVSTTNLAPVTALLTQVSAQLPADQQAAIAALVSQLNAGGVPSAAVLAPVGALLQQIAMTPGVPAPLLAVLNPIAATLGGTGGFTGLPSSPTDLAGLTGLLGTLSALPSGGIPSLTEIAPLIALLNQVSAQLPPDQKAAVDALVAELALGGAPSAAVLAPVGTLLLSIATAPGVPAPLSAVLGQLGASLAGRIPAVPPKPVVPVTPGTPGAGVFSGTPGGGGQPGATGPKATIQSVRVDARRMQIRVSVRCPAGSGSCVSAIYALRGKALAAPIQQLSVPAGASATRSLKLNGATRRALKKRGFSAVVGVVGPGGVDQRKATVKRAAKAKKAAKRTKAKRVA